MTALRLALAAALSLTLLACDREGESPDLAGAHHGRFYDVVDSEILPLGPPHPAARARLIPALVIPPARGAG